MLSTSCIWPWVSPTTVTEAPASWGLTCKGSEGQNCMTSDGGWRHLTDCHVVVVTLR